MALTHRMQACATRTTPFAHAHTYMRCRSHHTHAHPRRHTTHHTSRHRRRASGAPLLAQHASTADSTPVHHAAAKRPSTHTHTHTHTCTLRPTHTTHTLPHTRPTAPSPHASRPPLHSPPTTAHVGNYNTTSPHLTPSALLRATSTHIYTHYAGACPAAPTYAHFTQRWLCLRQCAPYAHTHATRHHQHNVHLQPHKPSHSRTLRRILGAVHPRSCAHRPHAQATPHPASCKQNLQKAQALHAQQHAAPSIR